MKALALALAIILLPMAARADEATRCAAMQRRCSVPFQREFERFTVTIDMTATGDTLLASIDTARVFIPMFLVYSTTGAISISPIFNVGTVAATYSNYWNAKAGMVSGDANISPQTLVTTVAAGSDVYVHVTTGGTGAGASAVTVDLIGIYE